MCHMCISLWGQQPYVIQPAGGSQQKSDILDIFTYFLYIIWCIEQNTEPLNKQALGDCAVVSTNSD